MRAVVEHRVTPDDPYPELPDVRVIISDGEDNEDVVIKVSAFPLHLSDTKVVAFPPLRKTDSIAVYDSDCVWLSGE